MNILEIKNDYYSRRAVNQSQLKALLSGIGTYKKAESNLFYEEEGHFIMGDLVDCYMTTPSLIESEFYIVPELQSKPSDKVMSIINEVYSRKRTDFLVDHCQEIYEALNNHDYYTNRMQETCEEDKRVFDIYSKHVDYWDALLECGGRQIISKEEKETAYKIVESFKNNPRTKDYFEGGNVIRLFQYPVYFRYSDLDCKALFDLLIINLKKKLIQPVDVKTMGGNTKEFPKNAMRHRYDIQSSYYTLALKMVGKLNIPLYGEIDISDFKILPFKFIVESTKSPGFLPLVYEISEEDMHIARFGGKKFTNIQTKSKLIPKEYEIKGFEEAIDLYKWHEMNEQWELDKAISTLPHLRLDMWNK